MAFLLPALFIILGLLILSLKGFFGEFEDGWEWSGIILAWVGLLVGVLQMILGRSKLVAYFTREPLGLVILLKNVPIKRNEIWYKLGVRRDTIQSLEMSCELRETGSQVVKQAIIHLVINDHADEQNKNRISLPPTFSVGAATKIVIWDETESKAVLTGDLRRKPLPLDYGRYTLDISFAVDGDSKRKKIDFVVGDGANKLMWVLPNPDKEDYLIR